MHSKQEWDLVVAYLDKEAKSSWDLLMDAVERGNSTKYQHYKQTRPNQPRQELSEIIAGEIVATLRESFEKTDGRYEPGISKVKAKWGLSEADIKKIFLESGSLGNQVFDLPPQKAGKHTGSLAQDIITAIKMVHDFHGKLQTAKEMVDGSKVKDKKPFYKMLSEVHNQSDLERALWNMHLKYTGSPVLTSEGDMSGLIASLDGVKVAATGTLSWKEDIPVDPGSYLAWFTDSYRKPHGEIISVIFDHDDENALKYSVNGHDWLKFEANPYSHFALINKP